MIDRRQLTGGLAALSLFAALPLTARAAELSEDGLHIQPFFMQTFLDMAEDKAEAAAFLYQSLLNALPPDHPYRSPIADALARLEKPKEHP